ncbi:hypothetical protein F5X99DRAFT_407047 [Biscogniauxia marginata]|nr:hypothetical protein F5X99DRAFT_407047 [Biscogniauxia marginata]
MQQVRECMDLLVLDEVTTDTGILYSLGFTVDNSRFPPRICNPPAFREFAVVEVPNARLEDIRGSNSVRQDHKESFQQYSSDHPDDFLNFSLSPSCGEHRFVVAMAASPHKRGADSDNPTYLHSDNLEYWRDSDNIGYIRKRTPDSENCSVYIASLVPETDYHDLLTRIGKVGKVYSAFILPCKEEYKNTALARIVMWDVYSQKRLIDQVTKGCLRNKPYFPIVIIPNKTRVAVQKRSDLSRAVRIAGPLPLVDPQLIHRILEQRGWYFCIEDTQGPKRDGEDFVTKVLFAGVYCQSEWALEVLRNNYATEERVNVQYGRDPCNPCDQSSWPDYSDTEEDGSSMCLVGLRSQALERQVVETGRSDINWKNMRFRQWWSPYG